MSKLGVDNLGWWSKKSPYAHGVGCWKFIYQVWSSFNTLVHFKIRIVLASCFRRMFGVVIVLLRLNFLVFLEWLVSKMQQCLK